MEINGFKIKVFKGVYPLSEDTFLLYDNIDDAGKICIEVCCGTGLIALKLASKKAYVIAIDVNKTACYNTLANAKENNLADKIDVVCGDLLSAIRKEAKVDIIACNPPYLPCEPETQEDIAWCGGKNGCEVILKLIDMYSELFEGQCPLYFIFSSYTNIDKVMKSIKKHGLVAKIVAKKECPFFETLYLIKVAKSKTINREDKNTIRELSSDESTGR